MRVIWILFGLLIAIPLGALTWVSSQVDADFLLETASSALEEQGISLLYAGDSTFSLVPRVHLALSNATIITPETEDSEAQQITLKDVELTTSLFTFWHSRRADISARQLTVNDIEIFDFASPVELIDGLRLEPISATLWQGEVQGFAQINTHNNPITIETRGQLDDATAASLLATVTTLGGAKGTLSAKWDLTVILPDSNKDIAALNGDMVITGNQVTLTEIDLQGGLCKAISRAQGKNGPKWNETGTLFDRLAVSQSFDGTKAKLDDLVLKTNFVLVQATADLDRVTEGFTAQASAKLNTETLSSVPNCRINPRLADIAWPINCRGQLNDGTARSWCTVDVSKIVEEGLNGELKRRFNLDNPASLIKSLLDRN